MLRRRGGAAGSGATAIACDYVVAADGAGSSVRASAGFGLSGRRGLGHLVNIHFRSKGLGRLLRAKERRPGMLYFVYNEACEGIHGRDIGALHACQRFDHRTLFREATC